MRTGTTPPVIEGLVSVVLPVRNRPRLLREAVESVRVQSYDRWELIVVEDGSGDDTPEVARSIAAESPEKVSVRSGPGRGPGPAREVGRAVARGEFLQYLDSDDLLLPRKLELQVRGLRADSLAGASYGWTLLRRADGSAAERPFKRSAERIETMFPSFLAGRPWNTTTPLYRASVCAAAGPWSDLWLEEDWEYDCRIAALGTRLHYVADWVCEYRDHDEPRLGLGEPLDPKRLGQQAEAHARIFGHARRAGIGPEVAEMAHFARALFLLARKCGRAGLRRECLRLLGLARDASTPEKARGFDFQLYRALVAAFGVRAGTVLAERLRGRGRTSGATAGSAA